MIRILKYKSKSTSKNNTYLINENENTLKITMRDKKKEYSISLDKYDCQGKIYNIVIIEDGGGESAIAYEKYEYISRSISPYFSAKKLAQVFFGKVDIVIALTIDCEEVLGYENIEIENDESMTGAFCRVSEEYKDTVRLSFAKQTMINNVDIYNSTTYLESQVDALTRIVLKLYKENDELKDILTEANKYSTLDIKDKNHILKEMSKDKKKIRELQKKYYESKN